MATAKYQLSNLVRVEIMRIFYKQYRYYRWGLLLLGVVFSSLVFALAPDQQKDTSRIDALTEALESKNIEPENKQSLTTPMLVPENYLDEAGRAALKTSLTAYYEYRTNGFHHRERVFEWQLMSSKIIFVIVIFLVLAGLYFSWLQFKVDMNQRTDHNNQQPVSTLEASVQGVKISSPVLGVIILVISLLFFYLYLEHVYPIEELL